MSTGKVPFAVVGREPAHVGGSSTGGQLSAAFLAFACPASAHGGEVFLAVIEAAALAGLLPGVLFLLLMPTPIRFRLLGVAGVAAATFLCLAFVWTVSSGGVGLAALAIAPWVAALVLRGALQSRYATR